MTRSCEVRDVARDTPYLLANLLYLTYWARLLQRLLEHLRRERRREHQVAEVHQELGGRRQRALPRSWRASDLLWTFAGSRRQELGEALLRLPGAVIGEPLTSAAEDEYLDFTDRGHGELARLVAPPLYQPDISVIYQSVPDICFISLVSA